MQPTLVPDAGHGHPALSFDGVDDALVVSGPPLPVAGRTIFAAVKWNAVRAYSFALGCAEGSEGYLRMSNATTLVTGGKYPVLYQNGIPFPKVGYAPNDGRQVFHNNLRNLTEWNVYAIPERKQAVEQLKYLGRNESNNTPENRFKGEIAEVLIFETILDAVARAQVERYLGEKYLNWPGLASVPVRKTSLPANDIDPGAIDLAGNVEHILAHGVTDTPLPPSRYRVQFQMRSTTGDRDRFNVQLGQDIQPLTVTPGDLSWTDYSVAFVIPVDHPTEATLVRVTGTGQEVKTGDVVSQAAVRNLHVQQLSPLALQEARVNKLFYFPDESVLGSITLASAAKDARNVDINAWLEQGIDTRRGQQSKTATIPPDGTATVDFTWPSTEVARYGQAMVVEVTVDGELVARERDFFTSHDNVWAVGIAGNHPVAFTAEHVKDMAGIERAVDKFRNSYTNTFEKFFWAPDDFANMTPEKEKWFSGQVRYHEQLDRLKHMCDYGRQIGVLPTTYGKSIGSGSGARDAVRENPELVYGFGGKMAYHPDTEELAKWDVDQEPYWQAIGWAHYNMNDPAVVQHGINEIAESTKMFGWAGVRFDGHFRARTGKQRVGDEIVDFTREMADAQTAANQRALKERMLQVDPHFVFGYNFAECDFHGRLIANPRESLELCEGGGHIMDEYAKQNAGPAHPMRKWSDYAHMIVSSAQQIRRLGGHYFPMVSTGPVGRYQTIFTFAGGGHPNATPGSIGHPYNAFATRYAELLWGDSVKTVWNPAGLVIVDPGVMWEDYVRRQDVDDNHTRLIIHLINPPAQETATETKAAVDEINRRQKRRATLKAEAAKAGVEPDYGELDSLPPVQLHPDPKGDIEVKLIPKALENGPWRITSAVVLDPETVTATPLDVDASERYFSQITVPEFKFWTVIVVECTK